MNSASVFTRLAREPLVHFLLLGALIFGADHLVAGRQDDRRTIRVGAEVDQEARGVFRASMQREPSAADMKILRERWVDNEVLYREALALGLDRGDSSIRERLIFKALNVTQTALELPPVDEAGLRAWFEAYRAKYDQPARFDFLEAVLIGDNQPETVKGFVAALNAGNGSGSGSDAQSSLRVFKARPRQNLVQSYGERFTAVLEKVPAGVWTALASSNGLRVVRLESLQPGVAANFDAVKAAVYADWKEATMQRLTTDAVRALGKKYRVEAVEAAK